jgi:methylisocitrate lyase
MARTQNCFPPALVSLEDGAGAFGYRMVLYPVSAFRIALAAARRALPTLREQGHQRDLVAEMLTCAELYDLLNSKDYEARDKTYFR